MRLIYTKLYNYHHSCSDGSTRRDVTAQDAWRGARGRGSQQARVGRCLVVTVAFEANVSPRRARAAPRLPLPLPLRRGARVCTRAGLQSHLVLRAAHTRRPHKLQHDARVTSCSPSPPQSPRPPRPHTHRHGGVGGRVGARPEREHAPAPPQLREHLAIAEAVEHRDAQPLQ